MLHNCKLFKLIYDHSKFDNIPYFFGDVIKCSFIGIRYNCLFSRCSKTVVHSSNLFFMNECTTILEVLFWSYTHCSLTEAFTHPVFQKLMLESSWWRQIKTKHSELFSYGLFCHCNTQEYFKIKLQRQCHCQPAWYRL